MNVSTSVPAVVLEQADPIGLLSGRLLFPSQVETGKRSPN
jgi:hypothetical protein